MLYKVMRHLRNFFATTTYHSGVFTVENGVINPPLDEGQYYLIEGSVKNDGVYKMPTALNDEKFYGVITLLAPPPAFIETVDAIKEYQDKHGNSPYVSESFGGYSYSKAQGKNGPITWKEVFAEDLKVWRRI